MDQYIGKLLDNRYEIMEQIGMGGMARVFRALERAFETAIPPEVYDAMEAELRGADGPA